MLGDRLYPLIERGQPKLAAKITGMLLPMDNSELFALLDSPEQLEKKIGEAVEVLEHHQRGRGNTPSTQIGYVGTRGTAATGESN